MKKSFSQIKNEVHDASGINNPEHYLWEQISNLTDVWYPVLNVHEMVEQTISGLFEDVQDECNATGDVDPHMHVEIERIQDKLTKLIIKQATTNQ